jgi:hypothetical protein
MIAGLGAVAVGMLLGRDAEGKPSGNKGNSGGKGNSDCNAVCAREAKVERKKCGGKDKKAAKKSCLQNAKQAQAKCRQKCVPTDNTGTGTGTQTGSAPATDVDSGETGAGEEFSILAKDLCTPGGTSCQDDLDESSPGNCLTATCTKSVSDGRYRCQYTRNTEECSGDNHICCNYRRDAKNSGMCVADVAHCKQ